MNLEESVLDGIDKVRAKLIDDDIFGASRIYLPFVIKILLLGAIMEHGGILPLLDKHHDAEK
jgi:hypothetical protein